MSDPREFWIDREPCDEDEDMPNVFDAFSEYPGQGPLQWQANLIHVIEYRAYLKLLEVCCQEHTQRTMLQHEVESLKSKLSKCLECLNVASKGLTGTRLEIVNDLLKEIGEIE